MSRRGDMMDAEFWRRVERAFELTVAQPASRRAAFVSRRWLGDPRIAHEVLALLATNPRLGETDARRTHAESQRSETPHPVVEIDGYTLLEPIGLGGMSTVFLAERDAGGVRTVVALKIVQRRSSPLMVRLFERERQLLARLDHPSIASYLDSGTTRDGEPFFAMEYVEGLPITRYCDVRRLTIPARLDLVLDVCEAVHFAHQNLIVHRDLKPSNILITDDGRPKLLDFGIAKDLQTEPENPDGNNTTTGNRFLTPSHASPEQIAGHTVTTATDVYALGVLLCELLCGLLPQPPIPRASSQSDTRSGRPELPSQLLHRRVRSRTDGDPSLASIVEARRTVPASLMRILRGDLDTLVARCLASDPDRRYPSASQLADDLRRYRAGEPLLARPPSWVDRTVKLVGRNPVAIAAVVLLFAFLIGFSVLTHRHAAAVARERDRAQLARQESDQAIRFLAATFRLADTVQRVDLVTGSNQEPSARDVLAHGTLQLHAGEQSPRLRGQLLTTLGEIHTNLGDVDEALALLREGLALRQTLFDSSSPEVTESATKLGQALNMAGALDNAEATLRHALENADPHRLSIEARAELLASLGAVYLQLHEYEKGLPVLQEAIQLLRPLGRTLPRPLAQALTDLGAILWLQRDFVAAETVLEEAIQTFERIANGNHPSTAAALQTLAFVQAMNGNAERAKTTIERSIALRRTLQGPAHPETLVALAAAGEILFLIRDYAGAEAALQDVLARDRQLKGDKHPDVAIDLISLTLALFEQGRAEEAEPLSREAIDIAIQVWGRDSHATTSQLQARAWVLEALGRYAEAEDLNREVLAFRRAHFEKDHRLIAFTSIALASTLERRSQTAEALALTRDALRVLRGSERRDERRLAVARGILGACLVAQGASDEGAQYLRSAITELIEQEGPEGREVHAMRGRLVRAGLAMEPSAPNQ